MSASADAPAPGRSSLEVEARSGAPLVSAAASSAREVHEQRHCTDVGCCMAFASALALLGAVGLLGLAEGDAAIFQRSVSGRDSQGRLCGVDEDVKDFKLTYFALLENYSVDNRTSWRTTRADLWPVCTSTCPQAPPGQRLHSATLRGAGLCPDDEYAAGRCSTYGRNNTRLADYCIDTAVFNPRGQGDWAQHMQDLRLSWPVLAAVPAIAILLGILFLALLHRCGAAVIWVGLCLATVIPSVAGVVIFQAVDATSASGEGLHHWAPAQRRQMACFLGVAAGLMVLLAGYFASAAKDVVEVLRATSGFLEDVPSQMAQPIFVGLAHGLFLAAWLGAFVQLASVNAEEGDWKACVSAGEVFCIQRHGGARTYGLDCMMLLMLYWVPNFLHALSQFGTASAMLCWYFANVHPETGRKLAGASLCDGRSALRGVGRGLRWHSGSLAFGACVTFPAKVARCFMRCVLNNPAANATNPVLVCVQWMVESLNTCFERFVEFLTEEAYAEVAWSGEGFCASARTSHGRGSAPHPFLFALLGRAGGAVQVLGVALVTAGSAYAVLLLLAFSPPSGLSTPAVPLVVTVVGASFVAEVMLHPLSAAARASLHCVSLDEDARRAPEPVRRLVEARGGAHRREQDAGGRAGGRRGRGVWLPYFFFPSF